MSAQATKVSGYNGLRKIEPSLPANVYFEPARFDAELRAIWYRNWIFACRSSDLAETKCYRLVRIGTQEILILRDEDGQLQAFHNTCRHRGSALCTSDSGRLKGRLIVCPYHAWSYSLKGELVRAPSAALPADFQKADFPLYRVAVEEWRGFVFVNLDENPRSGVAETFDEASVDLGNWPLEDMRLGHRFSKRMACNWKIFWENFNECLHCPGVHPELSNLVPIYGRGMMDRHDDPDWTEHKDSALPEHSGGLRSGAQSWSADGEARLARFSALTNAEAATGQSYATHLPSMFIVGHVDYVRTVRLMPIGPEETELIAEWYFPPDQQPPAKAEIDNIVSFGELVLQQDAAICEINQRGLRSIRHEQGVLLPEEYELRRFHQWVGEQMRSCERTI